ncbi:MAG: MerR family transcriptional regulator [Paracoccaceae bacterium]|nr:MerR family transcriptional regulator [Paracoccaceae bacterium]
MEKSRDAFRTISEVAEWLDIPTHVLRFWESRFSQIKPVKRAGGRRYYRPSDMRLIGGVKTLLHDQGMTIRGVQKILREQGIKHVAGFSPSLFDDEEGEVIEAVATPTFVRDATPAPAARVTHTAEPAPVEEDAQPDMFPEAPAPVAAETVESFPEDPDEPHIDAEPTIPDTPDVPSTDPADDDPAHEKDPGVAGRLRAMPISELRARAEVLRPLRDQLAALRDRIGE